MLYRVGVFVNHKTKEFSTAAQKTNSGNWEMMEDKEGARGFELLALGNDLTESQAKSSARKMVVMYKMIGYTKVSRQDKREYYAEKANDMDPNDLRGFPVLEKDGSVTIVS